LWLGVGKGWSGFGVLSLLAVSETVSYASKSGCGEDADAMTGGCVQGGK
jgi:hypothetical protein